MKANFWEAPWEACYSRVFVSCDHGEKAGKIKQVLVLGFFFMSLPVEGKGQRLKFEAAFWGSGDRVK